jgi:hypothetical protein
MSRFFKNPRKMVEELYQDLELAVPLFDVPPTLSPYLSHLPAGCYY